MGLDRVDLRAAKTLPSIYSLSIEGLSQSQTTFQLKVYHYIRLQFREKSVDRAASIVMAITHVQPGGI